MHVLLTGASSGIGESLAVEMAKAGFDLTLVARRKEKLEEVAAKCSGVKTFVYCQDLSDLDSFDTLLEKAREANGPIDILVNNAGVQIVGRLDEVDFDDGQWLLKVDVLAPFKLTSQVLPEMIARKSGTIVDISSLAGLCPVPGMYYYNAAKAALGAASESLRSEVKGHNIHVLTVYPGPVKTPMADRALDHYEKNPLMGMPIGDSVKLAKLILKGIRKKRSRIIYPGFYSLSRIFPVFARWIVDFVSPIPSSKNAAGEAGKSESSL